ncbi:hypothetical protein EWE75_24535 [Sphingomonas populi]|uniref:Uncharacterized protein n=1 Tax=Sphingomonas populi TaxID=2484750 RepID=A0A4Q6XLQ5_9SPHN|nr:hypothetical protein EWE75_24535 [Sphingomonas populi]
MSQIVCVIVNSEDAARLASVVADRNGSLKHIQRARIVLASSERLTVLEVARRTGASGLALASSLCRGRRGRVAARQNADSDEAGHLFRREAGHRSDLKPATWSVCTGRLV